jgi:hypothetical protein
MFGRENLRMRATMIITMHSRVRTPLWTWLFVRNFYDLLYQQRHYDGLIPHQRTPTTYLNTNFETLYKRLVCRKSDAPWFGGNFSGVGVGRVALHWGEAVLNYSAQCLKAESRLISHEIPSRLWNLKVNYRVHEGQTLSQLNPVHALFT